MAGVSRIEVVVNVAAGGVDRTAPDEIKQMLSDLGVSARVCAPEQGDLTPCLRQAVDAAPDLLILLAGDGTARAAAELCGPDGPALVPLPGGTMNMLPRALYGQRTWQAALSDVLTVGEARSIGGGEAEGHRFLVAGIFGSPARWAPAREAARHRKLKLAWLRARRALRRTFTGRLRYTLNGGQREKAEALVFICPLASRALDSGDDMLEAAALDVRGAADLFRVGVHALAGDWRDAPGVEVERCRLAHIWAAHGIPALLDGEPASLKSLAEVRYIPRVARILAIPKDA